MGVGSGAGGFSSSVQVSGKGSDIMGNEKFAMQNLNDRLANYLETVRNLEQANHKLEIKIKEALEKSGPDFRDYSKYQAILDDLRRKVRRGLGGGWWEQMGKCACVDLLGVRGKLNEGREVMWIKDETQRVMSDTCFEKLRWKCD